MDNVKDGHYYFIILLPTFYIREKMKEEQTNMHHVPTLLDNDTQYCAG